MSDWKQSAYPAGTPVLVHGIEMEWLGVGELLTPYDQTKNLDDDCEEGNEMPQIRLPNGRIIMGYDCWWIPEAEIGGRPLLGPRSG